MRLGWTIGILAFSATLVDVALDPAGAQQRPNQIEALDGAWTATATCASQSVTLPPLVVAGGRAQGTWGAGQMTISYAIGVSPAGAISGSASGPNVQGRIAGKVVDWRHGTAAGTFEVKGRVPGQPPPNNEMSCAGTWQAQKSG